MENLLEHLKVNRSKKLKDFLMLNSQRIKRYSLLVNELMKKKSLVVIIFTFWLNHCHIFAHEVVMDSLRTQIFSLSPISKKVGQVNGVVLGLGLEYDTKINGLNIEVHPFTPLAFLLVDPDKKDFKWLEKNTPKNINGFNVSMGNWEHYNNYNGLSLSLMHFYVESRGLYINGFYSSGKTNKGIVLTGLGNFIDNGDGLFFAVGGNHIQILNGISIGLFNHSIAMKGLQIGLSNKINISSKGLQIGIINTNKSGKGFQLGLWNINEKRTLPFINW
jgi:hypothetical protein